MRNFGGVNQADLHAVMESNEVLLLSFADCFPQTDSLTESPLLINFYTVHFMLASPSFENSKILILSPASRLFFFLSPSGPLLQECHAKWEEKRAENCVQDDTGRKRKFEKCDLDTYRSEEAYTNIFKKGKAEPIGAFLEGKGYDLTAIGNEKKQVKFITEDWTP